MTKLTKTIKKSNPAFENTDFDFKAAMVLFLDSEFNIVATATEREVLTFIETSEMNGTGEFEDDFFEERDEDGFHYTPCQYEITIPADAYLLDNLAEVGEAFYNTFLKEAA